NLRQHQGVIMSTAVLTGPAFTSDAFGGTAVPRLRITRRGRIVLTTLAAIPLVFAALFSAMNGGMATATDAAGPAEYASITVLPGDTLWGLASEIAPGIDPREVVEQLL